MSAELPSEEQQRLARELAEQLRRLRVEDVLVNTLMTVSSVGYRRLGATPDTLEDRDLDQTRLAIETMRALTPVLGRFIPGELVRDFESSVANLQLAYARVAQEAGEEVAAPSPDPEAEDGGPDEAMSDAPDEAKSDGPDEAESAPAESGASDTAEQGAAEPAKAPDEQG